MRGNGLSIRLPGSNAEELISVDENLIKPGFLETYGIKLLQGRDFQKDFASDRTGILINETTARKLGIENPVGKEALVGEFRGKIIGVFQDCHFRSLHHKIEPFILTQRLTRNYWISVKPEQGSTQMALSHLQNTLESYDPAYQFQYMFVDNYLERNYISDKENVTLVFSGTFLAIIISLMGLFALTAFNVEQRIKEIGIRKSLGASVDRIVRMFLSQYLKWIILASLLAFPLSYWFIERWFQEFAYHAEIRWWFFVLAFLISVSIATVTIWLKSYKAARQNPVDTLRYE
jgi:ABC-type antimicrobial peptide transport system permease subunit